MSHESHRAALYLNRNKIQKNQHKKDKSDLLRRVLEKSLKEESIQRPSPSPLFDTEMISKLSLSDPQKEEEGEGKRKKTKKRNLRKSKKNKNNTKKKYKKVNKKVNKK